MIVNPASAAGSTRRGWSAIAPRLKAALGGFEHAFTEGPSHATNLCRQALAKGYEMVVAIGGDGTCNEVANGFFQGGKGIADGAVMGIVSHGTGCDLRRTLGIEKSLDKACAQLAGRKTRTIDVGHARFLDHEGRPAERIFVNVLSFGCGGAVSNAISSSSKRLGGKLAFKLTTAKALLRYNDRNVAVRVDDGAERRLRITNYAVCNAQYFGGGMWVAPAAAVDDGILDATIWQGFGLKDFIFKQRMLYTGKHVDHPGTQTLRGRTFQATSDEQVLVDIDGESPGKPKQFRLPQQLLS